MKNYLGIDIGGSGFKYGWGNSANGLRYFSSVGLKHKTLVAFRDVAKRVLDDVDKRIGLVAISAVGIGSPGTIDKATGKVTGINPNLPFWTDVKPEEVIPPEYKLKVFSDNDANLMTLAEAKIVNKSIVLGITVGSGIGSGLVIDGKVFHGAHGFAGEIGHSCVVDNGLECSCGKHGCVEAYASVDGVRRRLISETSRYAMMDLPQLLTVKNVDPLVKSSIDEGSIRLSQAVANAICCCDPAAVIIGGGAMDLGLYKISDLHDQIMEMIPTAYAGKVLIQQAQYGNQAGVMGAILMAEQSLNAVSE